MATLLKDVFLRGATAVISLVVVQEYVGGVVVCYGPSMEPTVKTRDILLTDHITPRWGKIKKGDVVIARCPENMSSICKRVVGEAGDLVEYKGEALKIPHGHVWVEGDNKDDSHDSRDWGPLPLPLLRRRCCMKIWPRLDWRFGKLEGNVVAAAALKNKA